MQAIKQILETKLNGLNVKLFEYDIENEQSFCELKEYLVNKVRSSKVHKMDDYDLNYFGSRNLNPEFIKKFNECVARVNIPKKASIPQFDVRRERVTEWMAQYLLEKKYGCTFYDEADKRINLKTVEIDKHTDGIDVPGIRMDGDTIRFVICEVKASEDGNIPCGSVTSLQDDIQKAIDNKDNRTSREILEYMHGIRDVDLQDEMLKSIVGFLATLIAGEKGELVDNIIFFPMLIRNNNTIVTNMSVDDYKNFAVRGVDSENIENVILAFQKSFCDFSNDIYKEAIGIE
jgi:hypothetical protein